MWGLVPLHAKLSGADTDGRLFVCEIIGSGFGPPRHLHYDQDEWFYVVEGEFVIEVGQERFDMKPGDSLLAPRQAPHVWAYVGDTTGRMLIAFMPAGKMEAFFREVTKENAMPPQDPKLWQAHDMELLGPPLLVGTTPA